MYASFINLAIQVLDFKMFRLNLWMQKIQFSTQQSLYSSERKKIQSIAQPITEIKNAIN